MGKKSGSHGHGAGEKEEKASRAFVLKVAMHCSCDGCIDKIRAAVKDITLQQGIETWDQSALASKGELRLVATADPEKLRNRLHKATRKHVDLIFPNKDNKAHKANAGGNKDAAAAQALLLNTLALQQGGQNNNAWAANHLLAGAGNVGGGWNTHAAAGGYQQTAGGYAAYPSWTVQQQPDPYAAYSGGGAGWGGYSAYPPAHLQQGHYGQWHGY